MPKGITLTDEQKTEIQELRRDNIPADKIAKKLHLSKTTIHRVANNNKSSAKKLKRHHLVLHLHLTDRELSDLIVKHLYIQSSR